MNAAPGDHREPPSGSRTPAANAELGDHRELLRQACRSHRLAASRAGGATTRRYGIGGHVVALHLAGAPLTDTVAPALAHLETRAGRSDLDVHLWDIAATGVPAPVADVDRLQAWRRRAAWPPGDRSDVCIFHQPWEQVVGVLDGTVAVQWTADAAELPFYERSAPLLHLLHWWLIDRGVLVVHGGAVGRDGGGVLLAGASGSGKTTAALAGAHHGLHYAGDDYVAVALEPPRAFSLYCSAKVDPGHARRLGRLLPATSANPRRSGGEKALYFVDRDLATFFPLRAIALPRVGRGSATTVRPATAGAALAALAPSSMLQLPGGGAVALRLMRRLCEALPSYVLELGSDLEGVGSAVARLAGGWACT